MKRTTKTMALFTVLSLIAVGCQKESVEPIASTSVCAEKNTQYRLGYVIDGVIYHTTHSSEEEHAAFIYQMLDLAELGHSVTFYDENKVSQYSAAKEVVYFSTQDKTEAYAWADNMYAHGYKVSVTYDPTTQTFNCVAIR